MGAPTADDLDAVYAGHLGESVILVTDASTAARKYAEDKELPIIQLKSKTESRQGKYNLQKVNNLHSSFKQYLRGYNGVSTNTWKLCKSDLHSNRKPRQTQPQTGQRAAR